MAGTTARYETFLRSYQARKAARREYLRKWHEAAGPQYRRKQYTKHITRERARYLRRYQEKKEARVANKTNTVLLYLSPANHLILVRAGAENHALLDDRWTYLGPIQVGAKSLEVAFNRGVFFDPERIS